MRLLFALALFFLAFCHPVIGQSQKSKIKSLEQEVFELRLELAKCQQAQAQATTPPTRAALHETLLPQIKARSAAKFAKAEAIVGQTDQFLQYCENIKTALIQQASPSDPATGMPADIRNKDVTTRYLVAEKHGDALKASIDQLREQYLLAVQHDPLVVPKILLQTEALPPGTIATTWSAFKFDRMPLAAVFPMIGKFESDAKASEAAVLQYLNQ